MELEQRHVLNVYLFFFLALLAPWRLLRIPLASKLENRL
jgi:hypothetical protein